jgi:ribosome-associated protein
MTTTTSDSAAKKDIQKLQRVIVDALEDVKAQEIVVFDTEKQTALFERVMIASGTSNRQTRALAMSVRDAVNKAGFGKPRVEGEDNGEWIIVDCGSAVVHVMQPAIRSYYHLEELWGDIPVRLKFGSEKVATKTAAKTSAKTPAKKLTATQEAMIQIDKGDKAEKPMTLKRSNAAKTGVAEAFPSKAAIKKEAAIKSTKAAAAKKIAANTPAAKKAAAKKVAVKSTAAKTVTSAAPAKAATKVAAKKAPAKKVAAKKA